MERADDDVPTVPIRTSSPGSVDSADSVDAKDSAAVASSVAIEPPQAAAYLPADAVQVGPCPSPGFDEMGMAATLSAVTLAQGADSADFQAGRSAAHGSNASFGKAGSSSGGAIIAQTQAARRSSIGPIPMAATHSLLAIPASGNAVFKLPTSLPAAVAASKQTAAVSTQRPEQPAQTATASASELPVNNIQISVKSPLVSATVIATSPLALSGSASSSTVQAAAAEAASPRKLSSLSGPSSGSPTADLDATEAANAVNNTVNSKSNISRGSHASSSGGSGSNMRSDSDPGSFGGAGGAGGRPYSLDAEQLAPVAAHYQQSGCAPDMSPPKRAAMMRPTAHEDGYDRGHVQAATPPTAAHAPPGFPGGEVMFSPQGSSSEILSSTFLVTPLRYDPQMYLMRPKEDLFNLYLGAPIADNFGDRGLGTCLDGIQLATQATINCIDSCFVNAANMGLCSLLEVYGRESSRLSALYLIIRQISGVKSEEDDSSTQITVGIKWGLDTITKRDGTVIDIKEYRRLRANRLTKLKDLAHLCELMSVSLEDASVVDENNVFLGKAQVAWLCGTLFQVQFGVYNLIQSMTAEMEETKNNPPAQDSQSPPMNEMAADKASIRMTDMSDTSSSLEFDTKFFAHPHPPPHQPMSTMSSSPPSSSFSQHGISSTSGFLHSPYYRFGRMHTHRALVKIPNSVAGSVIGRAGSHIQAVEQRTDTRVELEAVEYQPGNIPISKDISYGGPSRFVTIYGSSPEHVQLAEELIEEKVRSVLSRESHEYRLLFWQPKNRIHQTSSGDAGRSFVQNPDAMGRMEQDVHLSSGPGGMIRKLSPGFSDHRYQDVLLQNASTSLALEQPSTGYAGQQFVDKIPGSFVHHRSQPGHIPAVPSYVLNQSRGSSMGGSLSMGAPRVGSPKGMRWHHNKGLGNRP